MTSLFLQLAIAACGVGAFIGGYALMHPQGGQRLLGLGEGAERSGLRALGGALMLGHAAALAALAQAPAIGSCLAAGLGSAWLGAAVGRTLSAVLERRRGRGTLGRIGFEALMGLLMWAPLWGYLRLIRRGAWSEAV